MIVPSVVRLWRITRLCEEDSHSKPCSTPGRTTRRTLYKGLQALMITISHSLNNLNCWGGLYALLLGLSASVPVISYTSEHR
jgi:hypothetical protein